MIQIGGGKCSLCGSQGTNKTTCPLNPTVTHPKPDKHPLATAPVPEIAPAPVAPAPEIVSAPVAPVPVLEVEHFLIPAGDKPLPEKDSKIVEDTLTHFKKICETSKDFQTTVRDQKKSLFRSEAPKKDTVDSIPRNALYRLLPGNNDPLDKIEKELFFVGNDGFLAVAYDVQKIIDDPKNSSYDNMKYLITYSGFEDETVPMVWIELLCVAPSQRKKRMAAILLKELEKKIITKYPDATYIIIGLDIAGTTGGWMNQGLATYYESLGFTFPGTDFYRYTKGGQIGFKTIESSNY